jgi:hypothetical protein
VLVARPLDIVGRDPVPRPKVPSASSDDLGGPNVWPYEKAPATALGALVRVSVRRIKVAMATACAQVWGLAASRLTAAARPPPG